MCMYMSPYACRYQSQTSWGRQCSALSEVLGKNWSMYTFTASSNVYPCLYILVSTLIQETDKAAYLVRQFIHFNLYDRIRYRDCQEISGHRYIHIHAVGSPCTVCAHVLCSTRPFLSVMEKRWIAFQLLKALDECHVKKVTQSHGLASTCY